MKTSEFDNLSEQASNIQLSLMAVLRGAQSGSYLTHAYFQASRQGFGGTTNISVSTKRTRRVTRLPQADVQLPDLTKHGHLVPLYRNVIEHPDGIVSGAVLR
jgi:hypothetical protein